MTFLTVAAKLECSVSTVERLIRSVTGKPQELGSINLIFSQKGCRRVTRSQLAMFLPKLEMEALTSKQKISFKWH
ncbi:MAG TPA: hypothetical protein VGL56_21020 [Fimbriimonadaceae bacterium]|jgi:hypothetical protein